MIVMILIGRESINRSINIFESYIICFTQTWKNILSVLHFSQHFVQNIEIITIGHHMHYWDSHFGT